jgi:anti-sigma factor RsiW
MRECARHRTGLVTLADGELHLVPERTLAHVRTCAACREEVETYSRLGHQVRQTLVTELETQRPVPPRLRLVRAPATGT